jgi:hypothetical protein
MRKTLATVAVLAMTTAVLFLAAGPAGSLAPTGQRAYSVRSDVDDTLYEVDLETGLATSVGVTGFSDVEGLTFGPDGVLYGVDDVTDVLVTIDLATGAGTSVGPLGVNVTDTGLTFDAAGDLFMSTDAPAPETLYRLDPATGAATAVGPQGQDVTGLAADATTIYGLGGDGTNNLVTVDPATGAATPVGPLTNVTLSDGGIDFDSDGTLWGMQDVGSTIFTIDPATGTATVVSTANDGTVDLPGFEGLAIAPPLAATADPTDVSGGTVVDVAGSFCYEAEATVTLLSDGAAVDEATATPDGVGDFTAEVTVPTDVDLDATLEVEVECGEQAVVLSLTLPAPPTPTPTPVAPRPATPASARPATPQFTG